MRNALGVILLCAILSAAPAASGGLVRPGQTKVIDSTDVALPAGTLVAERTLPFAIDYGGPTVPMTFDGVLRGTLRSAVYRGDAGALSFLYDVDLQVDGVAGAAERSELAVKSFAGFATWVTGSLDFEQLIQASRSANGKTVRLRSDTPGLGGPPLLIVRTDATAYAADGVATFAAADDVASVVGPTRLASGTATISGIYRPTDASVEPPPPPGPPPPASIPLPPAAYSALGLLLGVGALAATRRVWAVAGR